LGLRVAGTEELAHPDAAPAQRRAEVLKRLVREMIPGVDLTRATAWMEPRPGTPESLPSIGALPGRANIFVEIGQGHLALTGGPMTGRIIAALIAGERINLNLAPYCANRRTMPAAEPPPPTGHPQFALAS
jgi:glycine/D-amino acid oxidase-like deaminating enzyme